MTEDKRAKIYQLSPDTCMLMNCYIIKTVTDKLIVIDGGGVPTREQTSGYLYAELQNISGKNVPEVEAWFLSHMHDDHVNEFCIIAKDESKPIKINKMYFNFPEYEFFTKVEGGRFEALYNDVRLSYNKLFGENEFEKCEGKTAFNGDVIEIDGIKIEILLTYSKESNPDCINDTSMIFTAVTENQKAIFLGDAFNLQSEQLISRFGNKLKSDIVQMSHHGQNGVSEEAYKLISPSLCLWSAPDWVFDNWNGNLNSFETRKWMINQGVKYHLITGRYKSQSIDFPTDYNTIPEEDISVSSEKK
jgi:hypothetical protein